MAEALQCDLCGRRVPLHACYVVNMEVFADPSMPPITVEELERDDHAQTMEQLLAEMAKLSAEELQDQVHRRFEYRICRACHAAFLANPLGKPRGLPDAQARRN